MYPKPRGTHVAVVRLLLAFNAPGTRSAENAAESERRATAGLPLVANKGNQTLGIIDPVAGRQIATVL